jgi:hypothetical protein
MRQAHKKAKPIFLYPHAARPMIQWDGMFEPYKHIAANFVIADGHAEVMRRYGYPHPVDVCGWTYCTIQAFQPTSGRRVLFGPNHPNHNGWLSDVDMTTNHRTYEILLKLVRAGDIELTVQYLHKLEENGLWYEPEVTFLQSVPNQSVESIDAHDLVVSTQTLAYLAVARGKPTVMMGEQIPPHAGVNPDSLQFVASWEKYKDLLMYPLDILDTDEPFALLQMASRIDDPIREWRRMFIGKPFEPDLFSGRIEHYLERSDGPILEPHLRSRSEAGTTP